MLWFFWLWVSFTYLYHMDINWFAVVIHTCIRERKNSWIRISHINLDIIAVSHSLLIWWWSRDFVVIESKSESIWIEKYSSVRTCLVFYFVCRFFVAMQVQFTQYFSTCANTYAYEVVLVMFYGYIYMYSIVLVIFLVRFREILSIINSVKE